MTLIVPIPFDNANIRGGGSLGLSKIFSCFNGMDFSLMFKLTENLSWCAQNIFGGRMVGHEENISALVCERLSMIVAMQTIIKVIQSLDHVRIRIEARLTERQAVKFFNWLGWAETASAISVRGL